jgi:hypothetical protein
MGAIFDSRAGGSRVYCRLPTRILDGIGPSRRVVIQDGLTLACVDPLTFFEPELPSDVPLDIINYVRCANCLAASRRSHGHALLRKFRAHFLLDFELLDQAPEL